MTHVSSNNKVRSICSQLARKSLSVAAVSRPTSKECSKKLTLHDKLPVISEAVSQSRECRKPLRGPLSRSIGPRTSPLRHAPRVANDDETLSFMFNGTEHGICVTSYEAIDCRERIPAAGTIETIIGAAEKAVLVCEEELLVPKFVGIKNVLYSD